MTDPTSSWPIPASQTPSARRHIGVRAFLGTFGTSLFIQACTLAQGVIVARLLGPTGRGEFAAVLLWPMFFAFVSMFGVNVAIARRAAKAPSTETITQASLILALLTSCLGMVAGVFALPHLLLENQLSLLPLARNALVLIPAIQVSSYLGAIDKGSGKFLRFNITRAVFNPVYLSCLIALWILSLREVLWFVQAIFAAYVASATVRLVWTFRRPRIQGMVRQCAGTLREAAPFGIVQIGVEACSRLDSILVLWLLGTENLGLYAVALSAAGVAGSIAEATHTVTFAIAAQSQREEGFERLARVFRCSAIVWAVASILLAGAMPMLLPLVFGRDFSPAILIAVAAIPGTAFGGLAIVLDQALRAQGKPFAGLLARLVSIGTMVGAGYCGAMWRGGVGVALAFSIAQSAYLLMLIHSACKHYRGSSARAFLPGPLDLMNVIAHLRKSLSRLWTSLAGNQKAQDAGQRDSI